MPNANDELMHHGIDGQRWGVMHGPPYPLSRADHKRIIKSAESSTKRNLSYKQSRKHAKRMSDEDLNAAIDRLRREETYRNLVSKDKQEKSIARKARALDRKVAKAKIKQLKKEQEIRENQNKPKKERFGTAKELTKDAAKIGVNKLATAGFTSLAKALFPEDENAGKFDFTVYDENKNLLRGKATPAQAKALRASWSNKGSSIDTAKVDKKLNTSMNDVAKELKSVKTYQSFDDWKTDTKFNNLLENTMLNNSLPMSERYDVNEITKQIANHDYVYYI